MSALASITADVRRSIELLAGLDDQAATRVAEALSRWLAAEPFEDALGLPPYWRTRLQVAARDRAITELCKFHSDKNPSQIAIHISEYLESHDGSGPRPDGAEGYLHDLARLDCRLGERHLRRLIGQRFECMANASVPPFPKRARG